MMCSQTFLTASEREDSETPRKSLRAEETGLNLKSPELGLGGARGCFTGFVFGFAFGFGLAAAVVDLEREAAALVVAPVGGFFLAVAAAVAAEEEVDDDDEEARFKFRRLFPLKSPFAVWVLLCFLTPRSSLRSPPT